MKKRDSLAHKKIFLIFCVIALTAGILLGCSQEDVIYVIPEETPVVVETTPPPVEPLPEPEIDAIDAIYFAILNREESIDLSAYYFTVAQFDESCDIWFLIEENPVIDYLAGYQWHSINDIITKVVFDFKDIPPDYFIRLEQAVELAVDSINDMLREDYWQAELVCAINDYIAINCEYAYLPDGVTPDLDNGHSAYAVLVNSRAVCEGYAGAFMLIAQQFGLEVKKVSGVTVPGNENHMWNLVKVDGQWYHVDVTWNDPTPDKPGRALHDYLLLSDNTLSTYRNESTQYHASWDSNVPRATDTRYENAFWIYEEAPISFIEKNFYEWEHYYSELTFEEIIVTAVENYEAANVARFGYDIDELDAEIRKLYPYIGYSYIVNLNDIVISIESWVH